MDNLYKINGTSNLHEEQNRGAYLDPNFWPNWNETINNFKLLLLDKNKKKEHFSLLRLGHSEMSAFFIGLNIDERVGNFYPRQSERKTVPQDTLTKMFKSINNASNTSTQIGYDFKNWIDKLMNFVEYYNKTKSVKGTEFIQYNNSLPRKNMNEIIDFPLEIIYGSIANKWLLKTFNNKIGLIGAREKLNCIKQLMEHKEYQDYLETNSFTDYIVIPQRAALDLDLLENNIENEIKNSNAEIFLIGAGVSKLKFFHLLNKYNKIFIDVGHGIDLLAGYGDKTRPYCGNWQNYRIKQNNPDFIDIMVGHDMMGDIIYL